VLVDRSWQPAFDAVLTQQLREPMQERALESEIPRLTQIANDVSQRVRAQYEESPYPRWVGVAGQIEPVAALVTSMMPAIGKADPYKWCAVYSGKMGGGSNCGFVTLAQCRATAQGMGGFCEPNQFYTGPAERPVKRPRTTHNG
jgi:hypothetical protein